jgi:hypothetical protein
VPRLSARRFSRWSRDVRRGVASTAYGEGVAYSYDVVTGIRGGASRAHRYESEDPLGPGAVLRIGGRDWLVDRVEPGAGGEPARAEARPARYRLHLRHPDGREEIGAFRRFRAGGPRLGHAFTTLEDGQPASWQVVDERLAEDESGQPYLALIAERDFAEVESLPDHELEHALELPDDEAETGLADRLARAGESHLSVELVALEPGEAPDWEEARRYVEALVLEEIEDDLLETCGVRPDHDPRDSWLGTVQERLRSDLELFRADIEGGHDQIEEWDYRDGRVFASVGNPDDESDPLSGHGWMCRLVDSGALGAAGFARIRKAFL